MVQSKRGIFTRPGQQFPGLNMICFSQTLTLTRTLLPLVMLRKIVVLKNFPGRSRTVFSCAVSCGTFSPRFFIEERKNYRRSIIGGHFSHNRSKNLLAEHTFTSTCIGGSRVYSLENEKIRKYRPKTFLIQAFEKCQYFPNCIRVVREVIWPNTPP